MKMLTSFLVLFLFFITAGAAGNTDTQSDSAAVLAKLGLLQGYEDGSLRLENTIKRSEFFTLVVRLAGLDKDTGASEVDMTFKDVASSHWAYNYIKTAIKYKLVNGYPDHTVAPDNNVTYAEAMAVLIRLLGYEDTVAGKWPESIINQAARLGISNNLSLPADKQLTRGEMSVLVKNALTIDFKN